VTAPDLAIGVWRKSRHSGGGNDCVEMAWSGTRDRLFVRDSKNANGPRLGFGPAAWAALLGAVNERNE